MRKLCLIATFSQIDRLGSRTWLRAGLPMAMTVVVASMTALPPRDLNAQGAAKQASGEGVSGGENSGTKAQPVYPKAVASASGQLFAVDLDLPGVWQIGDSATLFSKGSNLLRKPMNRPHCVTPHPEGGVLVGDSATREVYWIASSGAEPKPLTDGKIGIPMALAVDPTGKTLYVGDAEKRATFRIPIEGGAPELVARVNARGFAFDQNGRLLAVTPDKEAIRSINVETNEVETVVNDRPFQFPNGLCWAGDHGFVTDTYGNCIWKFMADGSTEKWHEGPPLERPVGISISEGSLFVADPKQKQIFEFDLSDKSAKTRL